MALPHVEIEYKNGGLGLVVPSDDRVMGILLRGAGLGTGSEVVYSVDEVYAKIGGKPSAYAATFIGEFVRQVEEFFMVAGVGAELWFTGFPAATTYADIFSAGGPAEVMMRQSGGRVNVMGVSMFEETHVAPTMVDGLPNDLRPAIVAAQAFATSMASQQMPVRIILDGRHAADVPDLDLTTLTNNRVGVCLSSNRTGNHNTAIGLLLGRIASIPVNRNIGRVKDGAVPTVKSLLSSGTTIETLGAGAATLHNRGYMFLRRLPYKAGYYWNDDHMCCPGTDDYYSLANGRVIDKVARIAYATFAEELLDTVLVDQDSGKVVPTTLKYYQSRIERAVTLQMTDELSGVAAYVDPNQDILATSKLVIDLRVVPTGTNRVILVKLGLFNPNAA